MFYQIYDRGNTWEDSFIEERNSFFGSRADFIRTHQEIQPREDLEEDDI